MNKKQLAILAVCCISIVAIICTSNAANTKSKYATLYNDAVMAYDNADYVDAKNLLMSLPEDYEDSGNMLNELTILSATYAKALKHLTKNEFSDAIVELEKLPDNYIDKKIIMDNMWKLEILTSSRWGDIENYTSLSNWVYLVDFNIHAYNDKLEIWLSEDEDRLDGDELDLRNEYLEKIDAIELIEHNTKFIKSTDRDNFTIDISGIATGEYDIKLDYSTITYIKSN